jgi:putative ABC transport system permease protein
MKATASLAHLIHLSITLTWRDIRTGLKQFRFFLGTLCFGVTLIAFIHSTQSSLSHGLIDNGRDILGGDLSFSFVQHEAGSREYKWLSQHGSLSTIASLRTMARTEHQDPILLDLKIIDRAYPLAGTLLTEPEFNYDDTKNDAHFIYIDPLFLVKTQSKIGDIIRIGAADFRIAGTILSQPDALSSGISLGMAAIMSQEGFATTKLNHTGALIKWSYRLKLNAPDIQAQTLKKIIDEARSTFPQTAWDIKSSLNAAPQLASNIEHISQFLELLGLCALLLGGIAIEQSITAYLINKKDDFAIFIALGARPRSIIILALAQIFIFALIGSLSGSLLGNIAPFIISPFINSASFPLPLHVTFSLSLFIVPLFIGLSIALCFSLLPLLRLRRLSFSELMTLRQFQHMRAHKRDMMFFILGLLTLLLFIFMLSNDHRLTAYILAGGGAMMIIFMLCDYVMNIIARKNLHHPSPLWRMAWGNIHRFQSLRRSFSLACGFSFALMIFIGNVATSLQSQLAKNNTQNIPHYYITDIQERDLASILSFVGTQSSMTAHYVPMMRGRVMSVKDKIINPETVDENIRWVLEGDRGITYASSLPEGSHLTKGKWWDASYQGEPLISLEEGAAHGLGLDIGDYVTLNVLGKNIRARISNIRQVNWQSLGINFVFVFSQNSFAHMPFNYLLTLNAAPAQNDDLHFIRDLNTRFSDTTIIRVRDILDAINITLSQLSSVLMGATLLIFVSACLAVAASTHTHLRVRQYETAVLRALGAQNAQLAGIVSRETFMLALTALFIGVLSGTIASHELITRVFALPEQHLSLIYLILPLFLTLTMSVLMGRLTLRHVTSAPPARALAQN